MNQKAQGDRFARRCLMLLGALASAAVLVACDATEDVLEGTAATGAPIVGGAVDVVCSSGAALQTTTNDSGAWRVALGDRKLPCKMRVKGGTANNKVVTDEFHSVATVAGTANITPLTDLAVAQLAKESPATWFAKKDVADFAAIDTAKVEAAVTAVVNSLGVKDFLAGDNPLTTAFTAKVTATDKIDKALEALKAVNYADVLAAASSSATSEAFTSAVATFKTSIVAALPASTGGGGGSSTFACTDTSDFLPVAISTGKVRSPTADELAGYFREYNGSFDHAGDNNYVDSTATFASNGQVTVKWEGGQKTYTGTSFCYDTTIGSLAAGNTLYVNFGTTGKVDLWKKNGAFSGQMNRTDGKVTLSIQPSLKTGSSYLQITPIDVPNVTKPADQATFCSAVNGGTFGTLPVDQRGSAVVSDCTFSGSQGQIKVVIAQLSMEYLIKYVFY